MSCGCCLFAWNYDIFRKDENNSLLEREVPQIAWCSLVSSLAWPFSPSNWSWKGVGLEQWCEYKAQQGPQRMVKWKLIIQGKSWKSMYIKTNPSDLNFYISVNKALSSKYPHVDSISTVLYHKIQDIVLISAISWRYIVKWILDSKSIRVPI